MDRGCAKFSRVVQHQKESSMTEIIAVVSHKGGTGKTSLVQNLAYELSNQRVLAVDLDAQSSLTVGCGLDPTTERPTIYQALHDPDTTADAIVHLEHFDLLPANLDLALVEHQFIDHPDRNDKLKDVLAQIDNNYDYILIDSPPSLGFFAFNGPAAATQMIVPLQCEPYAYKTLDHTLQIIQLIEKSNPLLQLKAIVLTMYDRRLTLTRSIESTVRQRFGNQVPQSVIPVNVSIAEATLDGVPVGRYAPNSSGAQAYKALAQELYGLCRT